MMSIMLVQLPDGNWIDPREVRGVSAAPSFDPGGSIGPLPDRIVITTRGGGMLFFPCESFTAAVTLRDDLAEKFNESRRGDG